MFSSDVEDTRFGSLVAIEGDANIVSTQLRLLPPSSKILVLPALKDSIKISTEEQNAAFNARSFVRDVHKSFSCRIETARSFLDASTSTQPRLVFMNGGSVSARTTCITTICENVTNGDIREAEELFREIVKHGVSGLMKIDDVVEEISPTETETESEATLEEVTRYEDPIVAAMNAAESLDHATASLQPYENEEFEDDMSDHSEYSADDQTFSTPVTISQIKSQSDFAIPSIEKSGTAALTNGVNSNLESMRPGTSSTGEDDKSVFRTGGDAIRTSIITAPSRSASMMERRSQYILLAPKSPDATDSDCSDYYETESIQGSVDHVDKNSTTVMRERLSFIPLTPNKTEYLEAQIVDVAVHDVKRNVAKRTKSLDRGSFRRSFHPQSRVDIYSPQPFLPAHGLGIKRTGDLVFASGSSERFADMSSFENIPRTTFRKAAQTTIKRLTALNLAASNTHLYVDRGTDLEDSPSETVAEEEPEEEEPFMPVFPVVEDLIIHFTNKTPNDIFDSVIRSYKNGSYPVLPTTPSEAAVTDSRPSTAVDDFDHSSRPFSNITAETDDDGYHRRQELDPYNPDSYQPNGQCLWPAPRYPKDFAHTASIAGPLTPATTPPPTLSVVAEKFHEFSPMNSMSAVGIHNSLRAALNVYFAPETTNYRQYEYAAENDRFWKQMFRSDDTQKGEESTVDQILALGSEDGVSKDLFQEICGQVEKLGTKKRGITRTGKVDIRYAHVFHFLEYKMILTAGRYFISNVIQTERETILSESPFSNPDLLATLIVPQLETYLSYNTSTKFLVLTFSAIHLPVVLALRKLLGSDLFKIGGIIDALASDPPSSVSIRTSSQSIPAALNILSNEGAAAINSRTRISASAASFARTRAELQRQGSISSVVASRTPALSPSFSKANHLLPSTATDAEIASFLCNIWKTLIDKSAFYVTEPDSPAIIAVTSPPPIPPTPAVQTAEHTPRTPLGNAPTTGHSRNRSHARSSKVSSKVEQILGPQSHQQHVQNKKSIHQHHRHQSHYRTKSNANSFKASYDKENTFMYGHTYDHNRTASIRTTATELERRERQSERDWENFHIGGESEDDEWDRLYLPRVPKRTEKKASTKKALKWLGLA
jgi:hypothetical protein